MNRTILTLVTVGAMLVLGGKFLYEKSEQDALRQLEIEQIAERMELEKELTSQVEDALDLLKKVCDRPHPPRPGFHHDDLWKVFDARLLEIEERGNDPKELHALMGEILVFTWGLLIHMDENVASDATQRYWWLKKIWESSRPESYSPYRSC